MQFDGPITARLFVRTPWILGYQQGLNNCNSICDLPNVAKLYFLPSALDCLKMCQESFPHHNPVGNKLSLKIWKKCLLCGGFFQKWKRFKSWIFTDCKIWTKVCYLPKIQIFHIHILENTPSQSSNFFLKICFCLA